MHKLTISDKDKCSLVQIRSLQLQFLAGQEIELLKAGIRYVAEVNVTSLVYVSTYAIFCFIHSRCAGTSRGGYED